MKKTCLALLVSSLFVLAGCSENYTAEEAPAAAAASELRLMASFAIGGASKTAADTKRVRDVFASRFATTRGGLFELTVDLDDKAPETTAPTKVAIRAALSEISARVAEQTRAGGRSSVVLALTGHGVTSSDGVYKFLVSSAPGERTSEAYFTGDELIELLATVGADDLVVFFQSCESGTLVDDDAIEATASGIGALAQYIQQGVGARSKRLAIVTPVNAHVLSTSAWTDVLSTAFFGGDANADGTIGFGELREQIERAACAHPSFAPKAVYEDRSRKYFALPTSGVDPRFFEAGDPSSIALLKASSGTASSPPTTSDLCASATETFAFKYRADVALADFFARYTTFAEKGRASWTAALKTRALEQEAPSATRVTIVKHLLGTIKTMSDSNERRDALSSLAGAAGPLLDVDPTSHRAAREVIVRAITTEDALALTVVGLERIAAVEVYAAVRSNLASAALPRASASLRKLDSAWERLGAPASDYPYLLGELARLETLLPDAAPTILRLRTRMGS